MIITITCRSCATPTKVEVSSEAYDNWQSGEMLIQHVFPDMSPHIREMFISGLCDPCFKEVVEPE